MFQLVDVLSQMPMATISWRLKSSKCRQDVSLAGVRGGGGQRWVDVGVAKECVVVIEITRRNFQGKVCQIMYMYMYMYTCLYNVMYYSTCVCVCDV